MTAGNPGGGFEELLAQMGMLQQHLSDAEATVGHEVVEGSAGGGAVVVRASGELSFDAVRIDPAVLDEGDVSVLEDLVLAAVRDAAAKLQAVRREAMGAAVSGALGGLFGTLGDPFAVDDDDDDMDEDEDDDEDERAGGQLAGGEGTGTGTGDRSPSTGPA